MDKDIRTIGDIIEQLDLSQEELNKLLNDMADNIRRELQLDWIGDGVLLRLSSAGS